MTSYIEVINVNRAPVLEPIADIAVNENQLVSVVANASDPDLDTIIYSINDSRFSQNGSLFTWQTGYADAGIYDITVTASDGSLSDSKTLRVTVLNVNRAPVLDAIGNRIINVSDNLTILLNASDPDFDLLTYQFIGTLPSPYYFNGSTGLFRWTPSIADYGIYNVTFNVTDGSFYDYETISITVLAPPAPRNLSRIIIVSKDAFIRNGDKQRNEGANPILYLQKGGGMNVLTEFNISSIYVKNITEAYLVFNIEKSGDNFGTARNIVVHRLLTTFAEGNGWKIDMSPPISGTGSGVTWTCAIDTDISNNKENCASAWNGGKYASSSVANYWHTNNMAGEVKYNITLDIKNLASTTKSVGYILFKEGTSNSGNLTYYSKEGAQLMDDMSLAPKLVIKLKP